jgi:hypothetical protein
MNAKQPPTLLVWKSLDRDESNRFDDDLRRETNEMCIYSSKDPSRAFSSSLSFVGILQDQVYSIVYRKQDRLETTLSFEQSTIH